ncbi:dihydrodipicolinate synthase family protein [Jiangella alba]|uniref:4-hydroxy-tetrahydrodipicolinate synthase n=1 Tax=Jiangella alba TaxID=561176 RepID=A0A1H5MFI4_9ACTN|nr:dihydrodipicolinate synthase family protein [Jiangella alba]SEE87431.1 4-hydroxy-tetrahydrodipicolinate synthase [Jiangella alba]
MSDGFSLSGVFPASLTMFDEAGRLDQPATHRHLASLVDAGAHGLVVAGTSGEFVAMAPDEKVRLVATAVAAADGRVPVVAGTGTASTAESVELTRAAAAEGAAAVLVILPYYMRPHREEVLAHIRAVGAASPVPVLLYNNPANSGTTELDAVDVGMLYREGVIHGVKSTFPTVHQVPEVIDETGPDFAVFYGGFMAPLSGLAEGAHGWISGVLNVALAEALALYDAVRAGDLAAARRWAAAIRQYRYLYTRRPLGQVGDLALYRTMLELRGEHGGHCRLPLLPLTPEQRARLERIMTENPALRGIAVSGAPPR